MMAWVSWGLVAVGLALVTLAVMSVSGRLRPLRRALRRLSWRRQDLARLQSRAETLRTRADELALRAREVSALRARHEGRPDGG